MHLIVLLPCKNGANPRHNRSDFCLCFIMRMGHDPPQENTVHDKAPIRAARMNPDEMTAATTKAGWRCLAGLALALVALPFAAGSALAQGAVRSIHQDWQVRCDNPPGSHGEQCALIQSVTAEDKANVGLTVIVLKTADAKSRLMRVVAPLGVLLPSGLGLKIDNADIGRAGFVRCLPNGCIAEVVMDDELVKKLRGGQTATFIIFQTPEEGIGFPMSLKGFAEGYDKLP